ncbi:hypothetical protein [Aquimarina aquimarini]|uniref:hypothetical protein n=1 Tax=Aquimarina aquimarini TaxID=1191734 RepID=UPI000D55BDC7|nr:hypothetical protein [Aquimarina aquimarini]
MKYSDLDKKLQEAIEKAENIAIENIKEHQSFMPFILHGEKMNKVKKIVSKNIDEIIDIAEEEIAEMEDSDIVILIYQDIIRLNDGDVNSIVSQVYGFEEDSGYSFGLGYRIGKDKIQFLNKRVFLGEIRNFLMF